MTDLLKNAIIGKAITEFFTNKKSGIQFLKADIYANNTQGTAIFFDGTSCWQLVYRIDLENYNIELINELSGILSLDWKDEK